MRTISINLFKLVNLHKWIIVYLIQVTSAIFNLIYFPLCVFYDITNKQWGFVIAIVFKMENKKWISPNIESSDYPKILRKERKSIFIQQRFLRQIFCITLQKMSKLFIFPILFKKYYEINFKRFLNSLSHKKHTKYFSSDSF